MDECAVDNGGCEYRCDNTIGSYVCRCPDGYQLSDDLKHCQGIHRTHSMSYTTVEVSHNYLYTRSIGSCDIGIVQHTSEHYHQLMIGTSCKQLVKLNNSVTLIQLNLQTTKLTYFVIDVSTSRRKSSSGLTTSSGHQYVRACPIHGSIDDRYRKSVGYIQE